MSLLLDALKKAAQQKKDKDKSGAGSHVPDDTADGEQLQELSALDASEIAKAEVSDQLTDTVVTEGLTTHEATVVDTTEIDKTSIDKMALDHTSIDETAIDKTVLDSTTIDATEIDKTSIDKTALDHTSVDETAIDKTVLDNTTIDATEIDKTSIDKTILDHKSVDETAIDKTILDSTTIDETEIDKSTKDKTTQDQPSQNQSTAVDDVEDDSSLSVSTSDDRSHIEEAQSDPMSFYEETLASVSRIEEPEKKQKPPAEKTLEIGAITLDDIRKIEEALANQNEDDSLTGKHLSDNDPTQLADDYRFVDSTEYDEDISDSTVMKDDTLLRDQSSLSDEDRSLYIIDGADYDSDNTVISEETLNAKQAFEEIQARYKQQQQDAGDSLTADDVTHFMGDGISSAHFADDTITDGYKVSADSKSVTDQHVLSMTNYSFDGEGSQQRNGAGDNTATASSVDIDKLTNETISVEHRTSSRPYAPDNYDRTLLNLSNKDVSNIFPGLSPNSDTVMTPDYAKRIFLSKYNKVESRYFKIYSIVGILLLLTVVMFGLFQLQEESTSLDNGLVSLKRDPMPGIIKPLKEKEPERLFVPESGEFAVSGDQAADIIATAELSGAEQVDGTDQQAEEDLQNNAESTMGEDIVEQVDKQTDEQQTSGSIEKVAELKPAKVSVAKKAAAAKTSSTASSSSTLSISSGRQLSEKSQLLNEAYDAYEKGDLLTAKSLYNKVLVLDAVNRDALLGRAAIHIQDSEYQQAINLYQKVLVENPKDSMAITSLISVANIQPEAAESQLKTLLNEHPDSPFIHFVLGNIYGSQNRWSEAQASYFNALQSTPDNANYAYNMAISLEHLGKPSAAVTFYKKALVNSSRGLVTFDNQIVMQRIEVLTQ